MGNWAAHRAGDAAQRDTALTAQAMVPLRSAPPARLAHQLQHPRNVAASVL